MRIGAIPVVLHIGERTSWRNVSGRHCIRTDALSCLWFNQHEYSDFPYPIPAELTRPFVTLEMLCFLEPAVTDCTLSQHHDETRTIGRTLREG